MKIAKFTLKTLTPMFMGGADPLGEPELRAASIRGAMRFWFRAIAGAITNDPKEIYKLESEIFGNTEEKSNVVVRVRKQPKSESFIKYVKNVKHVWYLGYGLFRMGGDPDRKCFTPGEEAKIEIEYPSKAENVVAYSLWFIKNIGGLGARSRKGFGSVEIVSSSHNYLNKILNLPPYEVLTKSKILSCLSEVFDISQDSMAKKNQKIVLFPSLFPNFYEFEVIDTTIKDHHSLLSQLNNIYRDIRRNNLRKHERRYLGFSSGDKRRSSPLFIRPIKNKDGNFSIVLSLFKSKFYEDYPDPDFQIIWNTIRTTFKALERRYPNAQ